jgi:Flp pilus assembly protein TadD
VAFDKAVAALESAAKMDPTNGDAALALGRACLAIGNEEKAYTELQRATEATPIQAEAYGLLGDLYEGRGDYAEAATSYHAYLKLAGEVPSVLEKLGDAYFSMDNIETAAQTYIQLTSLEPARATPFIKAARALLANGNRREAERICRRGLSSNPQNEALQSLLSQITGAPERQPGSF